jgi:hypothetical protein
MEKVMSNTKRTESREVELTDDNLAVVVGGRPNTAELRLAREDFKSGNFADGRAHMLNYYNSLGGGWL